MSCAECAHHAAIEELLHSYVQRIDDGHLEGFAELFRHGRWNGIEGYDAVLSWLRRNVILYDGTPRTTHLMSAPRISVRHDTAHVRSTVTVLQQAEPSQPISTIAVNDYDDTFIRVDVGWRWLERSVLRRLRTDMRGHLRLNSDRDGVSRM
ncbi:MAG: hypothetical protein ABS81_01100 [Pseudonocardia sp. SCN 72-86]|nr:MAG: hypothetical protein ABS81_01100 [Pseudonocardia sp. SCN 72-86]